MRGVAGCLAYRSPFLGVVKPRTSLGKPTSLESWRKFFGKVCVFVLMVLDGFGPKGALVFESMVIVMVIVLRIRQAKDIPLLHDPSRCLEEGAWDIITMISDLENAAWLAKISGEGYPLMAPGNRTWQTGTTPVLKGKIRREANEHVGF